MAATYSSHTKKLHIYLNGLLLKELAAEPPQLYTNTSTADIGHSYLEEWKQSLPGKVRGGCRQQLSLRRLAVLWPRRAPAPPPPPRHPPAPPHPPA